MSAVASVRHAADRALYTVFGRRWLTYRARRAWDRRADVEPLVATAAYDTKDMATYWASGQRDLELMLDVARQGGGLRTSLAVEIGCGLGRVARCAASEFDRVIATDISTHMLKQAQELAAAPNLTYLLLGSDLKLPVATASADFVYAWTVFRHTSEIVFAGYLDEARRALKPGGVLAFEALVRASGAPFKPSLSNPVSEREYARDELMVYCREHGFVWRADREIPSVTPGTTNVVIAWSTPDSS